MVFVEKIGELNPYNSLLARDLPLNFVDTLHWDYDGDGDRDLITIATDGSIHYFQNDGSGRQTQITGKANPFAAINVGVGGKIAIDSGKLVVAAATGTVRYFDRLQPPQQPPQLTNTTVHATPVGSAWRLIGTGDFDGDGDDDILWQRNDGLVHYWEVQNGLRVSGRNPAAEALIDSSWRLKGAGDFDGDGDDDILWQRNDGLVHYWEMQNGVRVNSHNPDAEILVGSNWSLKGTGDFDGDGDDDILWQRNDGLVHYWEMQNGVKVNGRNPHANNLISSDWTIKGAGDFDGDGDDDILWQYKHDGHAYYWEMQNGNLVKGHKLETDLQATGNGRLIGAGDFNNNGTASLLWQKSNGQVVTTGRESQATATAKVTIETHSRHIALNQSVTNVIVGDFDGDGKDDFIRQEKGSWDDDLIGTAQVLLSRGDNTFQTYHGVELGANLKGDLTNLIVGDFNGDGKDDFIRQEKGWYAQDVSEATATLYLANSNGNGTFSVANIHKGGGFNGDLTNIIVGDFNGDGKDDFIRQEKGWYADDISDATATLYLANSNGNGTFSEVNIHNGGSFRGELTNIIVGDFNGDGKDDFIRQEKGWYVNDISHATASLYLANGNGTFSEVSIPKAIGLSGDLTNIIVGDFNGDGRDDFIRQEKGWYVHDPVESSGSVYLANANGGFSVVNLPDSLSGDYTNIIVGDYNGDGKDDFIRQEKGWYVQDVAEVTTSLFVSNGNGTFTSQNLQNISGDVTELVVGDINGDGYDDILGNGQQGQNTLLVGLSSRKVNALEDFVQQSTSHIGADTTLALAIASSMTAPSLQASLSGSNANLKQELSKQLLGASQSLVDVLAQNAVKQSTKTLASATSWALMFGGELASVILAKTGNAELSGYFGSGNTPLINVGDFGDSVAADAGEVVVQTLVNIITSPIQFFADLFKTPKIQKEWASLSSVYSFAGHSHGINYFGDNPRSPQANNNFISLIGTNHNDILKGRLYLNGANGDDVLVGRMNTHEDAFFNRISAQIATPHNRNGRFAPNATSAEKSKYNLELRTSTSYTSHLNSFPKLGTAYYPDTNNSILIGGAGNDKLFSNVTARLHGGTGDDYIRTTYYSREIDGGSENDVITLTVNSTDTAFNLQTIAGGTGNDILSIQTPYTQNVTLSNGSLQFQGVNAVTMSGIEQAMIAGDHRNNVINASGFSGTVMLKGGTGNDHLTGATQASSLLGEAGNDTLIGGAQGDVLVGGTGADTLTGNGGADVFLLNTNDAAHDTITDFNKAQGDIIVIDTTAFGKLFESDLANFRLGSSNGNGELYYGNNKLATIHGTDGANLRLGQDVIFTEYHVTAQV